VELPTPSQPGLEPAPFEGLRFPTFFRLASPPEPGETAVIRCLVQGVGRARFITDAVNDYFTRASEPGTVSITPDHLFERILLHDGKAALVLRCPDQTSVGAEIPLTVSVTDPSRTKPFVHRLKLLVTPAREPSDTSDSSSPSNSGALSLPKIVEIEEDSWAAEEFGPESGLAMQRDVDGGLVAKVNVANEYLKQSLMRTPESDRDLIRKRFVYGLVLCGVSLWKEYGEEENGEELIRSATKAVARVILPMILALGSLEHELALS